MNSSKNGIIMALLLWHYYGTITGNSNNEFIKKWQMNQ